MPRTTKTPTGPVAFEVSPTEDRILGHDPGSSVLYTHSARFTLKTAECCGGGLQDFVGQRRVVDRPREDQGSDKTRHCRQRLFPPRDG